MENNSDNILKVSNLGVTLQGQPILENVNFAARKGETLAILGPNGAGKTMLFKALLNLVPHTGKIEWQGKVKIGYVPQEISVKDIPISVKEFLSYGNVPQKESVLSTVKLEGKGLWNKSLGFLSGGELRRVLIAWAITDNPNVLLLDEPTSGVDVGSEEPIFVMLNQLKTRNAITILLITHDIHIVREYSDNLLALNKCTTFFGESKDIADLSTQKQIYGEAVCLGT